MIRICRAQRPSLQHSGRDLGRLVSVLKQLETCLKEIETFSGELRADLVTMCMGSIGVTAADGIAKATDPKLIGLPGRSRLCVTWEPELGRWTRRKVSLASKFAQMLVR